MKKIILLITTMFFPLVVNASSFYEDITILNNGDLYIKQSIAIDGEYNGFNLTLKYKYFDENSLYSADDLEIVKILYFVLWYG